MKITLTYDEVIEACRKHAQQKSNTQIPDDHEDYTFEVIIEGKDQDFDEIEFTVHGLD